MLGAAVGRFTGKSTDGYALLLTNRKSDHVVLVVGTKEVSGWEFERLIDYGDGLRGRLFVQGAQPGDYVHRPDALTEPRELTSALPGVIKGGIGYGSGSEAYFFSNDRWLNLPLTLSK